MEEKYIIFGGEKFPEDTVERIKAAVEFIDPVFAFILEGMLVYNEED